MNGWMLLTNNIDMGGKKQRGGRGKIDSFWATRSWSMFRKDNDKVENMDGNLQELKCW